MRLPGASLLRAFDFSPGLTNPYIPQELLEKDLEYEAAEAAGISRAMLLSNKKDEDDFGDDADDYFDDDEVELMTFNADDEWDMLEDEDFDFSADLLEGDEVWQS